MNKYPLLFLLILLSYPSWTQTDTGISDIWAISDRESIVLDLSTVSSLPHQDNIEMSGKHISAIIYYELDEEKNLTITRDVIFPQLRTYNKTNEPDWKKYRAYFRRTADATLSPHIHHDQKIINPTAVDSIEIAGMLTFYYSPVNDIQLTKVIYPSMDDRILVEEWKLYNLSDEEKAISLSNVNSSSSEFGYKGKYSFVVKSEAQEHISLGAKEQYSFPTYYAALLNEESSSDFDHHQAKQSRVAFLDHCRDNLILNTPDQVLNMLFYFSKIRASESIFHSSMGLVHSPGGGNYYVGIWANDQVEYSGPFFPYLNYESGDQAAYNTYQKFLENIPEDGSHIPYAFEVDGNFPMGHLDRGDAAMIAYGTSLYLLNTGDTTIATQLWPLVEWSLDYCHNNRNTAGAVESASDEMEGRIETGDANLSTSSLYYGGLKYSKQIAAALGMTTKAKLYEERLSEMETVIETYFGATMEGQETYRYFDGNQYLRHWICLPLTMGIDRRKEGTLRALFGKLWTENGILVEYDPSADQEKAIFWDRATLYALRGALTVGEDALAIPKLKAYSKKRLLGDHVPYAIEAYPENNMKHLSAESALYCRVFIEGLFGIEPVSFSAVTMAPSLPDSWNRVELKHIRLLGKVVDISLHRIGETLRLKLESDSEVLHDEVLVNQRPITINIH